MKKSLIPLVAVAIIAAGCSTTGEVKHLRDENKQLKADLTRSLADITELKADKRDLEKEIDVLRRVQSVLRTEKSSRVQESGRLRSQTRVFVNHEINRLRDFLKASDLLDYVGGELVKRSNVDGEQQLSIPAGTQSNTRFRLKGRGAPGLDNTPRGDQYVEVQLHTPTRLSAERRRLLEALAELEAEDDEDPGLFERVKKIFTQ